MVYVVISCLPLPSRISADACKSFASLRCHVSFPSQQRLLVATSKGDCVQSISKFNVALTLQQYVNSDYDVFSFVVNGS